MQNTPPVSRGQRGGECQLSLAAVCQEPCQQPSQQPLETLVHARVPAAAADIVAARAAGSTAGTSPSPVAAAASGCILIVIKILQLTASAA